MEDGDDGHWLKLLKARCLLGSGANGAAVEVVPAVDLAAVSGDCDDPGPRRWMKVAKVNQALRRQISNAAFGSVEHERLPAGKPLVLKVTSHFWNHSAKEVLEREWTTLRNITPHPNLATVYASVAAPIPRCVRPMLPLPMRAALEGGEEYRPRQYLMERFAGTMEDFMNHWPTPTPYHVLYPVAVDLLQACAALDRLGIVHGDVKMDNVLMKQHEDVCDGFVGGGGRCAIADWGISTVLPQSTADDLGAADDARQRRLGLPYRSPFPLLLNRLVLAPEVLRGHDEARASHHAAQAPDGSPEGEASDTGAAGSNVIPFWGQAAWVAGVTLYEAAMGNLSPWPRYPNVGDGISGTYRYRRRAGGDGSPPAPFCPGTGPHYRVADLPGLPACFPRAFRKLVRSLLHEDVAKRPTAAEALQALADPALQPQLVAVPSRSLAPDGAGSDGGERHGAASEKETGDIGEGEGVPSPQGEQGEESLDDDDDDNDDNDDDDIDNVEAARASPSLGLGQPFEAVDVEFVNAWAESCVVVVQQRGGSDRPWRVADAVSRLPRSFRARPTLREANLARTTHLPLCTAPGGSGVEHPLAATALLFRAGIAEDGLQSPVAPATPLDQRVRSQGTPHSVQAAAASGHALGSSGASHEAEEAPQGGMVAAGRGEGVARQPPPAPRGPPAHHLPRLATASPLSLRRAVDSAPPLVASPSMRAGFSTPLPGKAGVAGDGRTLPTTGLRHVARSCAVIQESCDGGGRVSAVPWPQGREHTVENCYSVPLVPDAAYTAFEARQDALATAAAATAERVSSVAGLNGSEGEGTAEEVGEDGEEAQAVGATPESCFGKDDPSRPQLLFGGKQLSGWERVADLVANMAPLDDELQPAGTRRRLVIHLSPSPADVTALSCDWWVDALPVSRLGILPTQRWEAAMRESYRSSAGGEEEPGACQLRVAWGRKGRRVYLTGEPRLWTRHSKNPLWVSQREIEHGPSIRDPLSKLASRWSAEEEQEQEQEEEEQEEQEEGEGEEESVAGEAQFAWRVELRCIQALAATCASSLFDGSSSAFSFERAAYLAACSASNHSDRPLLVAAAMALFRNLSCTESRGVAETLVQYSVPAWSAHAVEDLPVRILRGEEDAEAAHSLVPASEAVLADEGYVDEHIEWRKDLAMKVVEESVLASANLARFPELPLGIDAGSACRMISAALAISNPFVSERTELPADAGLPAEWPAWVRAGVRHTAWPLWATPRDSGAEAGPLLQGKEEVMLLQDHDPDAAHSEVRCGIGEAERVRRGVEATTELCKSSATMIAKMVELHVDQLQDAGDHTGAVAAAVEVCDAGVLSALLVCLRSSQHRRDWTGVEKAARVVVRLLAYEQVRSSSGAAAVFRGLARAMAGLGRASLRAIRAAAEEGDECDDEDDDGSPLPCAPRARRLARSVCSAIRNLACVEVRPNHHAAMALPGPTRWCWPDDSERNDVQRWGAAMALVSTGCVVAVEELMEELSLSDAAVEEGGRCALYNLLVLGSQQLEQQWQATASEGEAAAVATSTSPSAAAAAATTTTTTSAAAAANVVEPEAGEEVEDGGNEAAHSQAVSPGRSGALETNASGPECANTAVSGSVAAMPEAGTATPLVHADPSGARLNPVFVAEGRAGLNPLVVAASTPAGARNRPAGEEATIAVDGGGAAEGVPDWPAHAETQGPWPATVSRAALGWATVVLALLVVVLLVLLVVVLI